MAVESVTAKNVFERPLTPGESLWYFSLCEEPYLEGERAISYESKLEKFGRRASLALPRLTSPDKLFFYNQRQKERLLKEGSLPFGRLDREDILTFYARMWGVNMERLFDDPETNTSERLRGIWSQLEYMGLTLPQGVVMSMQMQEMNDNFYPDLVYPHPRVRVGGQDTLTWDELD